MRGDILFVTKGHVVLEGNEMVRIVHVHEAKTSSQAVLERNDYMDTLDQAIEKIKREEEGGKPKFVSDVFRCISCGYTDTVALDGGDENVIWCACGKVFVAGKSTKGAWKEIHDFSKGGKEV